MPQIMMCDTFDTGKLGGTRPAFPQRGESDASGQLCGPVVVLKLFWLLRFSIQLETPHPSFAPSYGGQAVVSYGD